MKTVSDPALKNLLRGIAFGGRGRKAMPVRRGVDLDSDISGLKLTYFTHSKLRSHGITTLRELVSYVEDNRLKTLKGIGPVVCSEVNKKLNDLGIA